MACQNEMSFTTHIKICLNYIYFWNTSNINFKCLFPVRILIIYPSNCLIIRLSNPSRLAQSGWDVPSHESPYALFQFLFWTLITNLTKCIICIYKHYQNVLSNLCYQQKRTIHKVLELESTMLGLWESKLITLDYSNPLILHTCIMQ